MQSHPNWRRRNSWFVYVFCPIELTWKEFEIYTTLSINWLNKELKTQSDCTIRSTMNRIDKYRCLYVYEIHEKRKVIYLYHSRKEDHQFQQLQSNPIRMCCWNTLFSYQRLHLCTLNSLETIRSSSMLNKEVTPELQNLVMESWLRFWLLIHTINPKTPIMTLTHAINQTLGVQR